MEKGKRRALHTLSAALVLAVVIAATTPLSALAYVREEAATIFGETEVTVYSGLTNSNDVDPYLASPGDYLAFNRYYTPGKVSSTSNITSSTNVETSSAGTAAGTEYICNGGVAGVSWDNDANMLTLNNASGTVITIEGPGVDPRELNTYNDKLSTIIDLEQANLTAYLQLDVFKMPDSAESDAPHTKDNRTIQDVVYINLIGTNTFNNIALSGNVKVVFCGEGSLTLNATASWDYDDYSEPDFDTMSDPGEFAVASVPTIGYQGSLSGTEEVSSTFPNGMTRVITETYAYSLPEIELGEGMSIVSGGTIHNSEQVKTTAYFTYTGTTAPLDESKLVENPVELPNSYELTYEGTAYKLTYDDAMQTFYIVVITDSRQGTFAAYDVSGEITSWEPWQSYIGEPGSPATAVVLQGSASTRAVESASSQSDSLLAEIDTQRVGGGGMGNAVGIYDYPQYFDEDGVFGVVAAGNFYINDFQVPANAEELAALGEEGFVVNSGATSLTAGDGVFLVDGKDKGSDYAAAVKALINDELPGGLHIDLYDTDGDGKAEVVKLWYTEGLIVNGISRDADGNYILYRGDLERVPSHAGRLYDADNFGGILGETVKPENFDATIQEGDGAIFYRTPDGWIVKRAVEANGIFVDGVDHDFYQIDDVKYTDTMKYSRDNLIVAQRNGEFANAHTYFGFKNNDRGVKVSMWMDPYSMSPIGITSNENAKVFLADAIAQSKEKLAGVTLTDAATAEQKFAYEALEEAIRLAEATLADEDSYNSEYDFYVYYLYLAQAGTGSDIGAAFSGFFTNAEFGWERMNAYPGFDALFAAAEPDAQPDSSAQTYTVASGDCLWNIAAQVYGSGARFGEIAAANGIADPYTIYVGQILVIPAG